MSGFFRCATLFVVGAVGCAADDAATDTGEVTGRVDALTTQTPDPNDAYFAEVFANGTGCPEGTWETAISPDGKVFTTTFSNYEVSVDPDSSSSIKDCMLSIKLHSRSGLSYAVSTFSYGGYAFLEEGATARLSARYYFQGNNVSPNTTRTNIDGHHDDTYLFEDQIETRDWVWSPCGVDRDLNIQTRLTLQSGDSRATGYVNLGAVDGRTESRLVFRLNWRECN